MKRVALGILGILAACAGQEPYVEPDGGVSVQGTTDLVATWATAHCERRWIECAYVTQSTPAVVLSCETNATLSAGCEARGDAWDCSALRAERHDECLAEIQAASCEQLRELPSCTPFTR